MPLLRAKVRLALVLTTTLIAGSACSSAPDDVRPSDLPYYSFYEGSYGEDERNASLADCYGGRGPAPDGTKLAGALRLQQQNARVWGSYIVGRSAEQVTTFSVTGTVRDAVFDAVFTTGRDGLHVGGSLTPTAAELSDPTGTLRVTSLLAGCR